MKRRQTGLRRLMYVTMALTLVLLLFPVYWTVVTALKTSMEACEYPPILAPNEPTVSSFENLLTVDSQFFVYYKNSFIVSGFAVLISTYAALVSGHTLPRFHFKWNRWILVGLLSSQMFPVVSYMISLYGLFGRANLIGTRVGLIPAVVMAQIPFYTILVLSFYDAIPRELEEAATVDGSRCFQALLQVIVPLVKPGILTIGVCSFLMTWDDYLYAATLIQTDALRTLSVGIALRYLGELSYDWSLVNAISVTGTLPMILLFAFSQKYMVRRLAAGTVKG